MISFWIEDSIKDKLVEDIYEIGIEIGRSIFQIEGALSVVCSCNKKTTKEIFAVNIMKKKVGYSHTQNNIGIFLKLDDKNLMRIVEVFETLSHINVVREYLIGKPLFQHFKDNGAYTENKVGNVIKQILSGVRYLHEHNIIHGNIKSENVILKDLGSHNCIVKICDHIQSTILHYDVYRLSVIALPSLCPPEILLSQIRTFAIDMWSIGICAFILLCGYEPFLRTKETELFRALINGQYTYTSNCDITSNTCKDFLNRLLVVDVKSRMNVVSALKHPWMSIFEMKNQPLDNIFRDFVNCVMNIKDRTTEKVMNDIRRTNEIFEKSILRNPHKKYS